MILDTDYMELALDEARKAYAKQEVPVGCVIVLDSVVIARAHNLKESLKDCMAHAEILAIKQAQKAMNDWRLDDCVMISTLEPCPMCAGAILHARLKKVIYGAKDLKWGAVETKASLFEKALFNHSCDVEYYATHECSALLTSFFQGRRKN